MQNTRGLSNLATFLMKFCQLLLMLYLQLCQLLQLSIIPCSIMSWTRVWTKEMSKYNPIVSVPLIFLLWIFSTKPQLAPPQHTSWQPKYSKYSKFTKDSFIFLYISETEFKFKWKMIWPLFYFAWRQSSLKSAFSKFWKNYKHFATQKLFWSVMVDLEDASYLERA